MDISLTICDKHRKLPLKKCKCFNENISESRDKDIDNILLRLHCQVGACDKRMMEEKIKNLNVYSTYEQRKIRPENHSKMSFECHFHDEHPSQQSKSF